MGVMTARVEKMFELARKLAHKSSSYHKLGCVIAYRSKVVSVGFNDMGKTHPKANSRFKTLHAEVDALIRLEDAAGCDAYVYREFKNGRKAMAKSCPACELALRKAGVKRIFYTTDGGWDMLVL
jgi:pyrimidine deaminase RibD-like protein